MRIKYFTYALLSLFCLVSSCKKFLDIPPKNIVEEEELFSSPKGMILYLSRMYSQMPFEDFKYSPARQFFDDWLVTPGTNEGSSLGRDAGEAMTSEGWARNGAYWVRGFNLLRDANILLDTLPKYKSNFSEAEFNQYNGEAYFARAMVFYALAKRYGGVPLVTKVLKYPESPAAELEIPRSSEEETWNQVLADFDKAAEFLPEASPVKGYANKYVALAFKSEAMLFAGSVAKYNEITGFGQKTKVRVIGFDAQSEVAAKKYFTEAYKAASAIVKSGKYSLYKKTWAANNKEAQYQNMVDMFFDASSPENIYTKDYKFPDLAHGFDSYNIPRQLMGGSGYSAGNCPTLDFVELFDGIPKNPNGTIKVLDANGKYVLYDKVTDLFANAEPRLRAYVILPGDVFKKEEIEIRRGIFTGPVTGGIAPLRTVNGSTNYSIAGPQTYNQVDAYTAKGAFAGNKSLFLSQNGTTHEVVKLLNGTEMNGGGKSGPFGNSDMTAAFTGFTIRKWLNPNMPQSLVLEGRSEQSFILMRYAEVLLNAAEAAAELMLAGEKSYEGDDLQTVAYNAIKDIRERAGADPLVSAGDILGAPGLKVIRKERRKELAFENKILWDIRRWRTQHSDMLNGFTQADGAYYRGLYPFYSSVANKYFFDAGFEEARKRFRFTEPEYYFLIPSDEVNKSPVIDQQPGR
ncbi:RagB/SusD family nutrient uptake outer membrane protein [Niabella beijingensis]|uniref:RagB/SusD family nutrient uptake outer membrane protein n=1 Tax=Niabella beijingensis TaxID=2872700 RepID=UPI001CBC5979|nr:RagB/SusD family nutrient uptake outer membrane protein [Niabella beijingensis]MBZ4187354.1 RagB/SusD family nutrient uptake outer membrane protein [Niabella beijingensis]